MLGLTILHVTLLSTLKNILWDYIYIYMDKNVGRSEEEPKGFNFHI